MSSAPVISSAATSTRFIVFTIQCGQIVSQFSMPNRGLVSTLAQISSGGRQPHWPWMPAPVRSDCLCPLLCQRPADFFRHAARSPLHQCIVSALYQNSANLAGLGLLCDSRFKRRCRLQGCFANVANTQMTPCLINSIPFCGQFGHIQLKRSTFKSSPTSANGYPGCFASFV